MTPVIATRRRYVPKEEYRWRISYVLKKINPARIRRLDPPTRYLTLKECLRLVPPNRWWYVYQESRTEFIEYLLFVTSQDIYEVRFADYIQAAEE